MTQYVFAHGLGQTSSSWDKTVSVMSIPTQTWCPDLWKLLGDDEVTYANLYQAFADYCNAVPGPLQLCGLSMGSILALNYAIAHPEKTESIVLIAAQYKMPKGLLKFQNVIFRLMPKSSFSSMGIPKNDVIKLTNSMLNLDFGARLKNVLCKTLILCGEKDNANKKASAHSSQNIPGAEFRLVENAAHEVNANAPEKLAAILDAF